MIGETKISFGIHKGKRIRDLPRGYLQWFYTANYLDWLDNKLYGQHKEIMEYIEKMRETIDKDET